MFGPEVKQRIILEISRGEIARQAGQEGRARVCARRAAAAAVREYLERNGLYLPGASVIDLLQTAQALPEFPIQASQVIKRLVMRVDENYAFPVDSDLLADARWLVEELEKLIEK